MGWGLLMAKLVGRLGAETIHPRYEGLLMLGVAAASYGIAELLISFYGLGMTRPERLFIAWFGPKGLASMLFALFVLHSSDPQRAVLFEVAAFTVLASIIAHGRRRVRPRVGRARRGTHARPPPQQAHLLAQRGQTQTPSSVRARFLACRHAALDPGGTPGGLRRSQSRGARSAGSCSTLQAPA